MKTLRPLLQILNRFLAARPLPAVVLVQTEFCLPASVGNPGKWAGRVQKTGNRKGSAQCL